jgi:hypothetical protein
MKFPYKTYLLLGISFITLYFIFYFTKAHQLPKQNIYSKIDTLQVPFVSNQGQWHKEILFSAQTFAGNFFIDSNHHLVYNIVKSEKPNSTKKNLANIVIKEILLNTNSLSIKPQNPSTAKVNYFKGNNPKQWISNIPTYHSISYGEIYPNIELQLKAYSKNIEKLFFIKPHAQIEDIKIKVEGIKDLKINEKGELVLSTSLGEILFTKPKGYYQDQKEQEIEVSYVVYSNDEYGFKIKDYDQSKTIVIDPLLASTYLGGSGGDIGTSIAMDYSGNVFITGYTNCNPFPTTAGAYDTSYNGTGDYDVFVAKFNSSLSTLLASTYLGGSNNEKGTSIAMDSSGNVFITGVTISSDFPTTLGAYDTDYNSDLDIFIAKFNNDLSSLLASTYLGGSGYEEVYSLAMDSSGNVFITGYTNSNPFPTTAGAYDTIYNNNWDVFVAKFNNDLSTLLASTYFGGNSNDYGRSLAMDSSGNVFITGFTNSNPFPTTSGAYDTSYNNNWDVFVAKFNSSLSTLLASTYLGGSGYEEVYSLAIDSSGNVFITGFTDSNNFPTPGGYDTTYNTGLDVFVAKFNNDLSALLASTYLGGSGYEEVYSLAIDSSGNVFITGNTNSNPFPTTSGAYDTTYNNNYDAFIAKFNNDLSNLLASTYLGGSNGDFGRSLAMDSSGNVFITGYTNSNPFPTTAGAYDTSFNGGDDVFVAKFDNDLSSGTGTLYNLTITISGNGSVTSNPAGINCPNDCSETYTQNQIVNFTPTPNAGYIFSGWSGDSDCSDGQITMDSNKTCNATFVSAPSSYTLTITISGNGSVTSNPAGINCPSFCTASFTQNQVVNLNAITEVNYYLLEWSGDCSDGQITMDSNKTCIAKFVKDNDEEIALLLFFANYRNLKLPCFIATATYGTPMAEEVQILRDFRDKYLITNLPGQLFVYLYYQISPPIAKIIQNNETLKTISRIVLTPIIYSIKYPNIALLLFSSSFLGLFLSFLINKKFRKQ